jgi:SAM-dependent methyltransferase
MTPLEASGPNAEQVRYWNDTAGTKWVSYQRVLDEQLGPLGRLTMDRAGVAAGEQVIDVGCGCGDTTITLSTRVAPGGTALGVDVSTAMVARAVESARAAGATTVRFENADAQTHAFPRAAFDVVYSRFGIMFFSDPAAAFANLRLALRPAGRLAFVCWQTITENPWLLLPLQAAAQHVQLPPPPAPDAPGPFAFADRERVGGILARAGFVDVAFEDVRTMLGIGGGGLDAAVDFIVCGIGPTSAALRDADPAVRPKVAAAVREALAPFVTRAGVRMPAAAWIVTGRRP